MSETITTERGILLSEAAAMFGIPLSTLRRWRQSRDLPSFRYNRGPWRVLPEDVASLLEVHHRRGHLLTEEE